MKTLLTFGFLLLPVLLMIGCSATRAGYESAAYAVVESQGDFELRDYPELVVATTTMGGEGPENDGSFMKLFRYISGGNKENQKISMTTPVLTTRNEKGEQEMNFVVPKDVAESGPPGPSSNEVRIRTIQGGRFAVYRFSGSWDRAKRETAEKKLEAWIAQQNLKAISKPQSANYDPPFTPAFLRRNEVMMRIEKAQ